MKDSVGAVDRYRIQIDLGPLPVKETLEDSFDELIERDGYALGPLPRLKQIRSELPPMREVVIENTFTGFRDDVYERRARLIIETAGFERVHRDPSGASSPYTATTRKPVTANYDYGMVLQEMLGEEEILRCHEFAREVYYYRDYNYDYSVARQFDPNADMFAVLSAEGSILGIGRAIISVPGYYCPFMYATTEDGRHVTIGEKEGKLCEVMGLYREGKQGIVAFKRLMSHLAIYAAEVARLDSIWTTYDESDEYTGRYYKRKLLMRETGHKLVYRDFGGLWDLVMTDNIQELAKAQPGMFAQ